MMRALVACCVFLGVLAAPALADIPKYPNSKITLQEWQAYLDAVKATPEVKCEAADQYHLYCYSRRLKTEWFFTTPANSAHPALIQRKSELGPDGIVISNTSHYAGSKRNFDAWYKDYEVLNRRSEDALARDIDKARQYAPQDWETQAVQTVIYDLWAAREMGQIDRTYAHLAPSTKLDVSREQWNQRGTEFRKLSGPVKSRKITSVRWYRELPGTAQPGVYAEVSVAAAFENVPAYQAQLVLLQQSDGTFRIVKEEERYGDTVVSSGSAPGPRAPSVAKAPSTTAPSGSAPAATPRAEQGATPASAARPAAKAAGSTPAPAKQMSAAASKGAGIPRDGGGKITEARFKDYLTAVRALPDVKCVRDNFKQFICDSRAQATEWVFTVPGHTAYPAVVQRRKVSGGANNRTEKIGHFAGSKEEFDIWFETFEELLDEESADSPPPHP